MSVQTFWSASRWSNLFGTWGQDYTIVKDPGGGGRHIGLDAASIGDIPCLVEGRVVSVRWTSSMGYCVEIDTGRKDGRYFTYCHIARDDLPAVGSLIAVGGRVGRTAYGPRGISTSSADFPGSAWRGTHCHLVVSNYRGAAWSEVTGRTLAAFYDPAPIIRSVLSGTASGGSTPLEDDVAYKDDIDLQNRLNQIVDFVAANFQGVTNVVTAEGGTTRQFVDRRVSDLAGWTRDDANATRAAVESGKIVLSQTQFDALTEAVAKGARNGGEQGAKQAIAGLSFVVQTS